jgi:hypothetical protein
MSDSVTAFESKDEFRYSTRLSFATTDAEEMCSSSGGNTSCYCCDKRWIWCGILFVKNLSHWPAREQSGRTALLTGNKSSFLLQVGEKTYFEIPSGEADFSAEQYTWCL